ncbi:MAG TPA: AMP-binding protein, partial [Rhodothermales bacterium]|nr:AMP-binding protein [Rhodothermales bacterium]
MSDTPERYAPPATFRERARIGSYEEYQQLYDRSVEDPEGFWAEQAQRITWSTPFHTVKNTRYTPGDVSIRWFEGGQLNACYNCVDRHVEAGRGDRVALIFERDDPNEEAERVTYADLHARVQKVANVLKAHGVQKGDRVTIYLPMTPDAVVAMLACARIGAVHSVVFAGFSPDSLADRILDGDSHLVVTADEARRGGKTIGLKTAVDRALERCPGVHTVLVVANTGAAVPMQPGRDHWLAEEMQHVPDTCPCEAMDAEDPLFILYTSGSTGKPKGVLHTTGG